MMKTYRLYYTHQFIPPKLFTCLSGSKILATINNRKVVVKEFEFELESEEPDIEDGTEVMFWLSAHGGCLHTKADHDQLEKELTAYWKEKERLKEESFNREKESADLFHASLKFPVKYRVGIKQVLHGLGSNSNGDGSYKSTVYHLILAEDIHGGKLKRRSGDFLCKQQLHGNWSAANDEEYFVENGKGLRYVPIITCKVCLNMLQNYTGTEKRHRWSKPLKKVFDGGSVCLDCGLLREKHGVNGVWYSNAKTNVHGWTKQPCIY